MKKLLLICTFISAVIFGLSIVYAKDDFGESVTYRAPGENTYIAGDTVTTDNVYYRDLYAAGGNVRIQKAVMGDLVVAGGAVQVDDQVVEDCFAAGGVVIINGDIAGDLRVFGGEVYINSKYIGGDLMAGAGKISISDNTTIIGDIRINGGETDENVIMNAQNNIRDINDAASSQDFTRYLPKDMNFDFNFPAMENLSVFSFVCNFIWFIGSFLAAYIVLKLFPVFSENILVKMQESPFKSLIFGYLSYFIVPIIVIVLAISIIGWPVMFALFLFGGLALFMAKVLTDYLVGRMILKILGLNKTGRLAPLFVGMALVSFVTWLINLIPFVGGIVTMFISMSLSALGIGAMIDNKIKSLR